MFARPRIVGLYPRRKRKLELFAFLVNKLHANALHVSRHDENLLMSAAMANQSHFFPSLLHAGLDIDAQDKVCLLRFALSLI